MKKFVLLSIIIIFFYSICYSEEKSIYNFDANENLFTAYAFMNAAGYNHDWSEMHQIRIEIRDYLDRKIINPTLSYCITLLHCTPSTQCQ